MSPSSPPRGRRAQDARNSGYDSYRPRSRRSPSRGRHAEPNERPPSRSRTRSRSRPPARSSYLPHPVTTKPADAALGSAKGTANAENPRAAADVQEVQNILTILFDASNQIPGVRWKAEAAAKTLADAQRNFDASKPGRHPEAAVSSNTQRLEKAKQVYEGITSEHTTLLQKHGNAIIRLAQAVQPQASNFPAEMEDLEQRIMMSVHQQLQSHKQAIREELEDRDRKLIRDFNARFTDMQTKLGNDMRKFMDNKLSQDIGSGLTPVKAELAALKIEVDALRQRSAENDSAPQPPVSPAEPVATLSALNQLHTKVETLESVQNDVASLKEDVRAVRDSHASSKTSIDGLRSKLSEDFDTLTSRAAHADSLRKELTVMKGDISKLQAKAIVVPQQTAEVSLQPLLPELNGMKAQISSLVSRVDVLASKEALNLEKELQKRGWQALLEQSHRHEIQLRQHVAISLARTGHPNQLDAELASDVRGVISDFSKFKMSVEHRLQALLGKVATLTGNCLHLQDRYESTSTHALHNAIVATMVRQYPVQEWRSAFGDLNARLQNLAQTTSRNYSTILANQNAPQSNNLAIAAYQEEQKNLAARIRAAESAIAADHAEADRRLSILEPRLLHDLNFEQRVLPLEKSTAELVETTAKLSTLISTNYDSLKASFDAQIASLESQNAQTSQDLGDLDFSLKGIVKEVRALEQSTNESTDSALLKKLLEKTTEEIDLRCNELSTALDKKADTALQRLEDTDTRLSSLQQFIGEEDDSSLANVALEPQTIVGLVKWIKDRCVSLEDTLHRSLADGRKQPEDWLESHEQVREGLRLRDDLLDSHIQILALGNKSLATRVTVAGGDRSRKVFQRSRQYSSDQTNLSRLKRSSYELESTNTALSTSIQASPGSSGMQPPQIGLGEAKRKRAGTNDMQQSSVPSSVSASETTPTGRGAGRLKRVKLVQSPESGPSSTPSGRRNSPEAPVSPDDYTVISD